MKISKALLCLDCDEVFEVKKPEKCGKLLCPSCGASTFVALSKWIQPMNVERVERDFSFMLNTILILVMFCIGLLIGGKVQSNTTTMLMQEMQKTRQILEEYPHAIVIDCNYARLLGFEPRGQDIIN